MRVVRRPEDFVAEDRNVALDASVARADRHDRVRRRGIVGSVFPEQISGGRVERLNDAARVGKIHDAVVDERRPFLSASIVHRPGPREVKLLDVPAGDLIERAIAPGVVGAAPVRPVARRRIAKRRFGDRLEVFDLRDEPEISEERGEPGYVRQRMTSAFCRVGSFF